MIHKHTQKAIANGCNFNNMQHQRSRRLPAPSCPTPHSHATAAVPGNNALTLQLVDVTRASAEEQN